MLLNLLIHYYVLKELICQDKYKEIIPKLKYKNARSVSIANFVITEKLRLLYNTEL